MTGVLDELVRDLVFDLSMEFRKLRPVEALPVMVGGVIAEVAAELVPEFAGVVA